MSRKYAIDPKVYDAWYQTSRGVWIAEQEFLSLLKLFTPNEGQTLLDVGIGSGNFHVVLGQ